MRGNVAVLVGVFGSMIGSFLNVVAYRVPLRRSIAAPGSACPACAVPIRAYDNIPVLSWIVLRGRCRACGTAISVRYPLVELGTGALFWLVAWHFLPPLLAADRPTTSAGAVLVLAAFLYLAAVSVVLTLIDLDTRTLPDRIVLPGYLVGGLLLTAASVLTGDGWSLLRAGAGLAALGLFYLTMVVAYPAGMGWGDVKLAGVLGLFLGYLGWQQLITGALAAFILGGGFGLILILLRKAGRKSAIPFGPWMLGGAWAGALIGEPIAHGYLSLFGLI